MKTVFSYVVAIACAFCLLYGSASAQCPGGKCPTVIQQSGGYAFQKYQIAQAAPGCPDKAWTSLATGKTLFEHSDGVWREYRQGHYDPASAGCPCDNGKCPCDRPIVFPTGPQKK